MWHPAHIVNGCFLCGANCHGPSLPAYRKHGEALSLKAFDKVLLHLCLVKDNLSRLNSKTEGSCVRNGENPTVT